MPGPRSTAQRIKDGLLFPVRAMFLPEVDRWGLSCWATDRFDYVARQVRGTCLDIGCGVGNRFVTEFLNGQGRGIDVFPYDGLAPEHVIPDLTVLPFPTASFHTVTFIANLNHVPVAHRPLQLREAFRVLKTGGNIVVTMGNPITEVLAHQMLRVHERIAGDKDVYHSHGVEEDEIYFLTDATIRGLLTDAGFSRIRKQYFWTQWCLNHLLVGEKA